MGGQTQACLRLRILIEISHLHQCAFYLLQDTGHLPPPPPPPPPQDPSTAPFQAADPASAAPLPPPPITLPAPANVEPAQQHAAPAQQMVNPSALTVYTWLPLLLQHLFVVLGKLNACFSHCMHMHTSSCEHASLAEHKFEALRDTLYSCIYVLAGR